MKKSIIQTVLFLLCMLPTIAQNVVQPKMMVIPYTKEGEDIRTVLEADENKRIVLTKIKEAFDERGVTTIDFIAKLKAMESGNVFNLDNKQDAKSLIIDMSGADIYVEAEIICLQGYVFILFPMFPSGFRNSPFSSFIALEAPDIEIAFLPYKVPSYI